MKAIAVITELQRMVDKHGEDVQVQLQDAANPNNDLGDDVVNYMTYEHFFIVDEEYDEGFVINIRSWPY